MVKYVIILSIAIYMGQLLDSINGASHKDDLLDLFKRQTTNGTKNPAGSGLYGKNDSVILLNATNMKENVFEQPYASMVEFFNSFCGFCQRYAPIWKQFASDILGWRRIIKVQALDCSREENTAICREFEVVTVPEIRFFAPYYKDGTQKYGEPIPDHKQVSLLIDALIEKMKNVTNKPATWPDFDPIKSSAPTKDLFVVTGSGPIPPKFAYIINENEPNETTIGSQVILDLLDDRQVVVKRTKNAPEPSGLKAIVGGSLIETKLPIDEFSRDKLTGAIQKHLAQNPIGTR